MISEKAVLEVVNRHTEGTGLFIVDIHVSASNSIRVVVDSDEGVTVKECSDLTRAIENGLDRDKEDFNLEVSSPGLSEPLKVLRQYSKNIGREVVIETVDGQKHKGKLTGLSDNGILFEELVKVKGEKKRPETKLMIRELDFDRVRSTKLVVLFK